MHAGFVLYFLFEQSLTTRKKEKRNKRDPQERKHILTDYPKFPYDLLAQKVAGNSIKEKMMPQVAILSEQVFLRTGTVFKFAYNICKSSAIKY